MVSGLFQLTSAQIEEKTQSQKLFGLEEIEKYLFNFCKSILTAKEKDLSNFNLYDLKPSVLLYGPPNTGKTTLCHLLFKKIKKEVTNEINFYSVDVGRLLDPSLGQSSRNLGDIFDHLKSICKKGSSVFLLLDELDAFCMSRSRTQEHDAIRRAMTTLMLELDELRPTQDQNILIFGITNVHELIDTAVVRRFSVKKSINAKLCPREFNNYLKYLSIPMKYNMGNKDIEKLYPIYRQKNFTIGDVKALYKEVYIDYLCHNLPRDHILERLNCLFNNGFSTEEHLLKTQKELNKL
ncbi:ATP-binding protein [Cyanobacterium aponinum UTEX 3222]|uniref:ATP-binding protein n=1 Tax=Cyanobacterium aponinum TaxID=379064 RepID=UPI00308D5C0D|nr:ATP-binding protein [Cyanobacterium aponinum UTEX 3222]